MMEINMDNTNHSIRSLHPAHGPFVKEGLMAAFPLCFPGVTDPIPLEESRITVLTQEPSGLLYGGTGGKGVHLFAACFKGVTGAVWDLGLVDGASECTGIACGKERLIAGVNGPCGSRIISRKVESVPDYDLLQEWSFIRRPYEELTWSLTSERILDLVRSAHTPVAVGISEHHIFDVQIDQGRCEVIADMDCAPRLMVGSDGVVYGVNVEEQTLWLFDPTSRRLIRNAVKLAPGALGQGPLVRSQAVQNDIFYMANPEGRLFSFIPGQEIQDLGVKTPLTPVRCLAAIPDGRVYGFCGEEIEHLFMFKPKSGVIIDLGVAVSVIERRRYGYQFAAAVVNQDGHIFFGEADNLGHLWIYFPSL
jgi:hypothetical protein